MPIYLAGSVWFAPPDALKVNLSKLFRSSLYLYPVLIINSASKKHSEIVRSQELLLLNSLIILADQLAKISSAYDFGK